MKIFRIRNVLKVIVMFFPLALIILSSYLMSVSDTEVKVDDRFIYGIIITFIYMGISRLDDTLSYLKCSINRTYIIVLGATIILSCFNLIMFTHIDTGFSYSFSKLPKFGINPVYFLLLAVYIIAYKEELDDIFAERDEFSSKGEEELFQSDIDIYTERYRNKSEIELREVLDKSECYTEPAIVAVKRLLNDKTGDIQKSRDE
ncbi:MAG: hypothetical protein N4A72_08860 [Bacteroidales bacterium]|jgi:fumarate reductase subunit D|nr:hypothetical protein [Bacteroidales bacterium]